jgi:hypothetical protein
MPKAAETTRERRAAVELGRRGRTDEGQRPATGTLVVRIKCPILLEVACGRPAARSRMTLTEVIQPPKVRLGD